jgi:hypothetical protein
MLYLYHTDKRLSKSISAQRPRTLGALEAYNPMIETQPLGVDEDYIGIPHKMRVIE